MSKSTRIIQDLLKGDKSIEDPSGILPDLKIAFEEDRWNRESIKRIADRHRNALSDYGNAT